MKYIALFSLVVVASHCATKPTLIPYALLIQCTSQSVLGLQEQLVKPMLQEYLQDDWDAGKVYTGAPRWVTIYAVPGKYNPESFSPSRNLSVSVSAMERSIEREPKKKKGYSIQLYVDRLAAGECFIYRDSAQKKVILPINWGVTADWDERLDIREDACKRVHAALGYILCA